LTDTLALWIWLAGVAAAGGIAYLVSTRKTRRADRGHMLSGHFGDEKRKLDH
jgi:hypothetical protein